MCAVVRRDSTSSVLMQMAYRIQRLSPSHKNPEKYHEDKSEIVEELKRVARSLDHHGAPPRRTTADEGVRRG